MADKKKFYLDKIQEVMEKALEHEQMAEFSSIAANLIIDELEAHPEVRGTNVERDYLKRHKKHIARAKWHVKQVDKLEKKYKHYNNLADAALSD